MAGLSRPSSFLPQGVAMRSLAFAAFVLLAGGCTWVKLDDAAQGVRVAYNGNVVGCRELGEIGVSVKDKVGFYQRSELKVRDELESLARNEAVGLHADTIRALDEPHDGEQRYAAYACGKARPAAGAKPAAADGAEVFPVKDR